MCNCKDVYIIYEGGDFNQIFEILSRIKNKKINIENDFIEKYKNMNENIIFEQNWLSKVAIGV